MKRFYTPLLFLLVCLGATIGGWRYNDRFRIKHVFTKDPYEEKWDLHSPIPSNIDSLLEGEFTYLGKGSQVYVFENSDKTVVLKIFRQNRFHPSPSLCSHSKKTIEKYQLRKERLFNGCTLAYTELKEESALLHIQLQPSCVLHKTLYLRDKLGRRYAINTDDIAFILQRKATLVFPFIEKLMNEGKIYTAKRALTTLLDDLLLHYHKGVFNEDPSLKKNSGFIGDRTIILDMGCLVKRNLTPLEISVDLQKVTSTLYKWLTLHYPELASHLAAELAYKQQELL